MTSTSIIGTGNMGRAIATRFAGAGHDVQVVDRDPEKAKALAAEVGATAATLGDPLTGDVVVLALYFGPAQEVVSALGDALAGKVVVEISNPLDTTTFDRLVTSRDTSAAEEIASLLPSGTPVVKAFNTTFAATIAAGGVDGQELDVLLAGDDDAAKATVADLVERSGLRPIDVGALDRAHWLEGLGLLHIGLQMSRGTGFATGIKLIGG